MAGVSGEGTMDWSVTAGVKDASPIDGLREPRPLTPNRGYNDFCSTD